MGSRWPKHNIANGLKGFLGAAFLGGLDEAVYNIDNKVDELNATKANKNEVTNGMTPKGACIYAGLPSEGNTVGDYYYCTDGNVIYGAGNYAWDGYSWYFSGNGDNGYNILSGEINKMSSAFIFKEQYLLEANRTCGKYYTAYNGVLSTEVSDTALIYPPIELKGGVLYSFKYVYGYFTYIFDKYGTYIKRLTNDTSIGYSGTYTPDDDCILYLTADSRMGNHAHMLVNCLEMPDSYVEGVYSIEIPVENIDLSNFENSLASIRSDMQNFETKNAIIHVDKNGNGDYTKVVEAVNYANSLDKNVDIYINEGEYDLLEEFGGSTWLNTIRHEGEFAERQGLILSKNVNLYGVGRVVLRYFLPDDATYVQSQCTSCVNLYTTNRIENIEFEAKNCRYVCHDETDGGNPKLVRYIKNCRFTHFGNTTNKWEYPSVYGGGAGGGSQYDFINCQFITDNYFQAFSFHTNYSQRPSHFNIDGCVGIVKTANGNSFRCSYYGTNQKGKTIFNFKNCSGNGNIVKQAETSDSNDHIEMYLSGYTKLTL